MLRFTNAESKGDKLPGAVSPIRPKMGTGGTGLMNLEGVRIVGWCEMKCVGRVLTLAMLPALALMAAQNPPVISLVANAEGENPVIAPNTRVEVKGQNLSNAGDSRVWQGSDL
jgi:hypothetical protein